MPSLFKDEQMIPVLTYIVWDNPEAVQALLYQYGYPAATGKEDLFNMASELLGNKNAEVKPKLWALHPDKDTILNTFGTQPVKDTKQFSVCNLCKSNFTGTQAIAYRDLMQGNTSDVLLIELQNVITSFNNAADTATKGDAAFKAMILGDLLSQTTATGWQIPPEIVTYFNQNVASQGTGQTTTAAPATNAQKVKKSFSLNHLSYKEKAAGLVAIGLMAGTLLTWLITKDNTSASDDSAE